MAKSQRVPADVKKQIMDRIKEGGVSIKQIAEEHGISNHFTVNSKLIWQILTDLNLWEN